MGLLVLRCFFVLVAAGLSVTFVTSGLIPEDNTWMSYAVFGGMMLLALAVIAVDVALRRKRLDTVTAVYFGLIVGLGIAALRRKTDLSSDTEHCGGCDSRCDPNRSTGCVDGACMCGSIDQCPSGTTLYPLCHMAPVTPPHRCCSGECVRIDDFSFPECCMAMKFGMVTREMTPIIPMTTRISTSE